MGDMNDSWKNMYIDNHPRKPDYTSAMSLLAHLNVDELREVLNDERKFEELIKDVKELKTVEAEKEILIASNRSLAEFNLSQEPILLKGRQAILELSDKGEEYSQNIEKKMNELNSRSGGTSLETAFALLQTAAAEMEEESDEIANKFLEGDTDVDTFLDQFKSRRELMHLRKVKTDKMSEMLTRRANPVQANASSFYQAPHPPAPSGLPYPVGPVGGLPMPNIYSSNSNFG